MNDDWGIGVARAREGMIVVDAALMPKARS